MSNPFWLTDAQMARLQPLLSQEFPKIGKQSGGLFS